MAVGLGAFGIVVRVTLDIEPTYLVRQDAYTGLPWDRVLAESTPILSAAYSVSLFTDWSGESLRAAWVKRRVDGRRTPMPSPEEFFGARRDPGPVRFIDAPADNLTVLGVAGPWSERLPHFRLDSTPSNGDEIQSEYFVDRRHGAAALEAVRPLSRADHAAADGLRDPRHRPGPAVAERVVRPRDDGDPLHLAQPARRGRRRAAEVEAALAPFAARPHWGKVSHVQADQVAELLPAAGRRARPVRAARPRAAGSATTGWSGWASAPAR